MNKRLDFVWFNYSMIDVRPRLKQGQRSIIPYFSMLETTINVIFNTETYFFGWMKDYSEREILCRIFGLRDFFSFLGFSIWGGGG